jgi:hypothetical protein
MMTIAAKVWAKAKGFCPNKKTSPRLSKEEKPVPNNL